MSIKEAEAKYVEYIKGHKQNVMEALDLLYSLEIPFVVEHFDELKDICSKHDDSKYSDEEFEPYREHFYAITDEEKLKSEAFENAVRHHIKNNKHHWDYWVDENNQLQIPDDEEYKLYTIERINDWLAMANQHGENTTSWWEANRDAIIMPDYAIELVDDIMSKLPEKTDFSFKQTRGDLDEGFKIIRGYKKYLVEANLQQLKRVALSQDPTRVKRSKQVKSTYIGISKYGVLNFKTTSEEKAGVYWYQELQFPSFNRFMNIIEQGDEITSDDIVKVLKSDNIKISCFAEETEVQTSDGIKKIKDVKVGDKVLTHTGKYQEVLQTFENDYSGEMVEINGVKSTPNHPYLVKLPNGDIDWKMACEITTDMKLLEIKSDML